MKKINALAFVLIPLLICATIFITPDKSISQNENRNLKTKKDISFSTFQDDFEAYLSDQFIARDSIASARSVFAYAIGKRDINGTYICKDRLIQKITNADIDETACVRYAEKIDILSNNLPTYVMYVPSAGVMLKSQLPRFADMYDYNRLFNELSSKMPNVKIIRLNHIDYYLTDHHWNSNGSYSAYLQWCKAHGIASKSFKFYTASTDFKGTLYSKALLNNIDSDTIKAPIIDDDIEVMADGQSIALYDFSALNTKDKYNFFQGGNHGVLTICNKNVNNGKRLLILKDSFANSFVPYIVGDYEKIVMLDERYTFVSPNDIIENENITELAIIKEIIS